MKILIFDFNNLLTDVIEELKKRGHTILPLDGKKSTAKKADRIVLWNETEEGNWKQWIRENKKGKKVILFQHGRRGTSKIYPPFNEKLESDIVCVWSENDKKRLIASGVDESKIRITGSPIFKYLKPKVKHKGLNVVFSPEHWGNEDVVENFIIKSQLEKLPLNINVITKILENEHHPALYQNPVMSNRSKPNHLEICADVLSEADLVVSISESTFELMAQALDIPVVIADIWIPKACEGDETYRDYHREYSDACTRVKDIKKLNEIIISYLKSSQHLQRERKQIAIDDGGIGLDAIENIIKVILEK